MAKTNRHKVNKIGPWTEPCGTPRVAKGPSLKLTSNVFVMSHICEKNAHGKSYPFKQIVTWNVKMTKN